MTRKKEPPDLPRDPLARPLITLAEGWETVVQEEAGRAQLAAVLEDYLRERRWFRSKAKEIKSVVIADVVPMPSGTETAFLTLVTVDYVDGDPETYLLPLAYAMGEAADNLQRDHPQLPIARLQIEGGAAAGVLYDAMADKQFCLTLLAAIDRGRTFQGEEGQVRASHTPALRRILEGATSAVEPSPVGAEQSNTAVVFGDRLILKLFRKLEPGVNPDVEINRFLTEKGFAHVPPLAGVLEYENKEREWTSLGILHGFIVDGKDGWEYTLDALSRFYERVQTALAAGSKEPVVAPTLTAGLISDLPTHVPEMIGTYLEAAHLLGKRTAEMHLTLASDPRNKDFAPEPFSPHYQRSLYQSMGNLLTQNFQLLCKQAGTLPPDVQAEAQKVLSLESEINKRFRAIYERRLSALRIRCHGDYHLGQVLHTGKDFMILDFEGEPARSLSERRIKRSPMRDVAGMIRSFHYAAYAALFKQVDRGAVTAEDLARFEPWTRYWYYWVSMAFLSSYLPEVRRAGLLPPDDEGLNVVLETNLLNKAIYELGYELNNRPAWLKIPLQGILQLVKS